jgi:hypothetical protein
MCTKANSFVSQTRNSDIRLYETVGGLILLSKPRVIRPICVLFIEALTAGDQKPEGAEQNHWRNDQDHPHGWDPAYPRLAGFRCSLVCPIFAVALRPNRREIEDFT